MNKFFVLTFIALVCLMAAPTQSNAQCPEDEDCGWTGDEGGGSGTPEDCIRISLGMTSELVGFNWMGQPIFRFCETFQNACPVYGYYDGVYNHIFDWVYSDVMSRCWTV